MKYIYNISTLKNHNDNNVLEEKIGKKAQNLFELAIQGFNVPNFSIITNKYFKEVILNEIKENGRNTENYYEINDWNSIFNENAEQKI